MSELGVTVEDLVRTLKGRRVRMPAEIGTFVALECAEQLLAGPARVSMKDVRISEEGLVSLFVAGGSASPAESAASVVSMLAGLLVAAGTAVPTSLVGLVEAGSPTGPEALVLLRDHLEAALVPLNRQAARRVLSRMIREARRPTTERPPAAAADDVDQAIDALLDGPPTAPYIAPEPASPVRAPVVRSAAEVDLDDELDAVLGAPLAAPEPALETRSDALREPPRPEPLRSEPARPAPLRSEPLHAEPRSIEAPDTLLDAPAPRRPVRSVELPPEELPRSGGGIWFGLASFIAVVAVGAFVFARQRPDLVDAWLGRPPAGVVPDAGIVAPPPPLAGTLDVASTPSQAQVFMFVGRGPVVVDELPTGVPHEFLVIADGRAPQRVLVPADAQWEETPEGPRYELAAQVGPALGAGVAPESVDLGPSLMTRGGTPGALGSVRVVTNPPAAKVYQLIGFTPDVHVENLASDEAHELLLWHAEHRLERVVVGPSDWTGEGSAQEAHVNATLTPNDPPRRR